MSWKGYEFSSYTSEDIDGIVRLFSFLREADEESNREYFIWKHLRNPFLKKPIGVVAKYGDQVVGFSGGVPAEWRIGDSRIALLVGADAVVHPEHRRKGLHVSMLKARFQLYSNEYRFGISFTGGSIAQTPASRLGAKPIAPRHYLWRLNWLRLFGSKLSRSGGNLVELGRFGDVDVSDTVRPADISRIALAGLCSANKLYLNKTPDFLEWRLSKPKAKYVYFYHLSKSKVDAYVILSSDIHAHVLDYGEEAGSLGVTKLLSFILSHNRFASISILNVGIPMDLEVFLRKKHFYTLGQVERLRDRESYNLQIRTRPLKEIYDEDDWFIDGVDVRDINNWSITEICFD